MSLRYRIAFYVFGLIIGCWAVGKFLGAKAESRGVAFCYFPNCRVIKELRSKPFKTTPQIDSIFVQNNLTKAQFDAALENGEVNFKKSNIKIDGGKQYEVVTQLPNNKKVRLTFSNLTKQVVLTNLKFI